MFPVPDVQNSLVYDRVRKGKLGGLNRNAKAT